VKERRAKTWKEVNTGRKRWGMSIALGMEERRRLVGFKDIKERQASREKGGWASGES